MGVKDAPPSQVQKEILNDLRLHHFDCRFLVFLRLFGRSEILDASSRKRPGKPAHNLKRLDL